jgi:hypothetical protein
MNTFFATIAGRTFLLETTASAKLLEQLYPSARIDDEPAARVDGLATAFVQTYIKETQGARAITN